MHEKIAEQVVVYAKMVCPITDCDFTVGIEKNMNGPEKLMIRHLMEHSMDEIEDFMDDDELKELKLRIFDEEND